MRRLQFDYRMHIDYTMEVSRCFYTIKCIPQSNKRQTIANLQIELTPETVCSEAVDGLGNRQIYGVYKIPHHQSFFRITGEATMEEQDYEEEADPSTTMIFSHPHGLNRAGEEIRKYYRCIREEIGQRTDLNNLALAEAMMHCLHRDFHYQALCTTVNTTAEEAFSQGRGVCQDYAHIFIAMLHLAGIPARYVTGLLIGEGESHAWVEVMSDHRWYGLDPTNDTRVFDSHIKIGVGRDAKDCMINRGIIQGGGLHTQRVMVSVSEIGE